MRDFAVLLESEDGRIRTLRPEAFRLAACYPSTLLLSTCIERYNARMERERIRETARLVPACTR